MKKWLFFEILVFFYFLTLAADQLHVELFFFKPKIGHLIAIFLLGSLFVSHRLKMIDRRCIWCWMGLVSSLALSALFSPFPIRSLGYVFVGIFTFLVYFLLPINLMQIMDLHRLLKIYFTSFLVVGVHAALQVGLSCFQIYDPWLLQEPIVGIISRGQSWTYEPSFYALYAAPFVFFINTRYLLEPIRIRQLIGYNSLLLVSITTSAFFAYVMFVITVLGFQVFAFCRRTFPQFLRRFLCFLAGFACFFGVLSLLFRDLFTATYYKFFAATFVQMNSFAARWKGIVAAWEVFLHYPLFGLGVGGVGPFLYVQEQEGNAPVMLYHPTLEMIELCDPTNVFTEMLASLGIYGLVVFAIFGWVFFRLFVDAITLAIPEEKRILLAWLISSIVMLLCLQINQGLFRSYVWAHLGLGIGYALKQVRGHPERS